jgi:hypothetical protein
MGRWKRSREEGREGRGVNGQEEEECGKNRVGREIKSVTFALSMKTNLLNTIYVLSLNDRDD